MTSKRKLFVGNLPFIFSDAELAAIFRPYGALAGCKVIRDPTREDGRGQGYGFVEFEVEEDAREALAKADGYLAGGRFIRVSIANSARAVPPLGRDDQTGSRQ